MTEPKAGLKRGYYLLNTDGGMASDGRLPREMNAEADRLVRDALGHRD